MSSRTMLLKCRSNAVKMISSLYRAKKIVITSSKIGRAKIDLIPSYRTINLYLSQSIQEEDVTKDVVLGIMMGYNRRRVLKLISDFISIMGFAVIGEYIFASLGLEGLGGYIVGVASVAALIYALYIYSQATITTVVKDSEANMILSDQFCREVYESLTALFTWAIHARDEFKGSLGNRRSILSRLGYKRRITLDNMYRNIIEGYPSLKQLLRRKHY